MKVRLHAFLATTPHESDGQGGHLDEWKGKGMNGRTERRANWKKKNG